MQNFLAPSLSSCISQSPHRLLNFPIPSSTALVVPLSSASHIQVLFPVMELLIPITLLQFLHLLAAQYRNTFHIPFPELLLGLKAAQYVLGMLAEHWAFSRTA